MISPLLVPSGLRQHLVAMHSQLVAIVCQVLEDLPCSERQLARDAGLAASTLSRIRSGERNATPDTVRKLADALASWAHRSSVAEQTLRRALEGGDNE